MKNIIGWILIGSVVFFLVGGMLSVAYIEGQLPSFLLASGVVGIAILGAYLVGSNQ